MKTLNYYLGRILTLGAIVFVSSCQLHDDDPIVEPVDNVIQFVPEIETKGVKLNKFTIKDFVAFGYTHGSSDWSTVSTTATPNLMWNNKYNKVSTSWVGQTQTRWPNTSFNRYSFFAYSPAVAAGNKLTVNTTSTSAGYQKLGYETLADVPSQIDLVMASKLNQSPSNEIPLSFSHMLSRIGFSVYSDLTGVGVKSITINGIKYKGEIDLGGNWITVMPDKGSFTANINEPEVSANSQIPTNLTGPNGEFYFLLIPQDLSSNVDNSICVTIVTVRNGMENTSSYVIKENYQKGKSLLYKVLLKPGTKLSVECTVTDWSPSNVLADVKANYLIVSSLNEQTIPIYLYYNTDYTGTVQVKEYGTTGKLAITHDPVKKIIYVTGNNGGDYTVQIVAGNLTRLVAVHLPDQYYTSNDGWAGSNIYWDDTKKQLTFADYGTTYDESRMGVYFQWGSLVALSGSGAWYNTSSIIFAPGTKDQASNTWSASTNVSYTSIPTPVPPVNTDNTYSYLLRIHEPNKNIGDICKYMTDKGWAPASPKGWRMPTIFELLNGAFGTKEGPFSDATNLPAGNATTASGYSNSSGVFLPASGGRNLSTGALLDQGIAGYYWSSTPYNNIDSYALLFTGGVMTTINWVPSRYGFPVRCVRNK